MYYNYIQLDYTFLERQNCVFNNSLLYHLEPCLAVDNIINTYLMLKKPRNRMNFPQPDKGPS